MVRQSGSNSETGAHGPLHSVLKMNQDQLNVTPTNCFATVAMPGGSRGALGRIATARSYGHQMSPSPVALRISLY